MLNNFIKLKDLDKNYKQLSYLPSMIILDSPPVDSPHRPGLWLLSPRWAPAGQCAAQHLLRPPARLRPLHLPHVVAPSIPGLADQPQRIQVRAIISKEKYDESFKDFRLRIGHPSLSQISMIFITRNLLSTMDPLVFWTIYWAQKHDLSILSYIQLFTHLCLGFCGHMLIFPSGVRLPVDKDKPSI